jgi:uncharacterized protein with GYD domain
VPKYSIQGGYTPETWAKFMANPSDRTQAASRACEAVGGKLEKLYWSFGSDDFLAIIECPDDVAAAALAVAIGSTGTMRNLRTARLVEAREIKEVLEKAKTAGAVYVPPGAKEPARAR